MRKRKKLVRLCMESLPLAIIRNQGDLGVSLKGVANSTIDYFHTLSDDEHLQRILTFPPYNLSTKNAEDFIEKYRKLEQD